MLPPTSARFPSPAIRSPSTDDVVDFPLVPVTATTRSKLASASQSPSPPASVTPADRSSSASARYLLIPGVLTTTSHAASAVRPGPSVRRTAASAGLSSTSTGSTPRERSLRTFAAPSRPSPQTPTRDPRRSAQEILGRVLPLPGRRDDPPDPPIRAPVGAARGSRGVPWASTALAPLPPSSVAPLSPSAAGAL